MNALTAIEGCNGHIRLQANRYGGGWMCVILLEELFTDEEEHVFNEMFDDMVGGDNDYFNAKEYFENHEKIAYCVGETPFSALEKALLSAEAYYFE